jgi:Rad3-related DNA helicase
MPGPVDDAVEDAVDAVDGDTSDAVDGALATAVGALPGGGEDRPGQVEMAEPVAAAVAGGRHLVVRAGTGTGKSLAYLVPAILSGRRVVVATATKALQDQLAGKDLPFLAEHLDVEFHAAVLKGRSNYLCRQRVHEHSPGSDGQLSLTEELLPSTKEEVKRLAENPEVASILDMQRLNAILNNWPDRQPAEYTQEEAQMLAVPDNLGAAYFIENMTKANYPVLHPSNKTR